MNTLRTMYNWMGRQVYSPYATPILSVLFFIEAIFFLPVDPILIIYCLEHRKKAWFYASVATISSVAGGVVGYYIGYALWQIFSPFIIGWLISAEKFTQAAELFKQYEMWAVLIAGFTPIPYKAVTYTAGVCKLPIIPFIIYSFIARGARFYLLAGIIGTWGAQIKEYIDRYFNLLVALFLFIVLGATWLIKFIRM